jgi:hypothetical protein
MRQWMGSRLAGAAVVLAIGGLFLVACSPEASRARNGGLGGSSRPSAPPTVVSDPALVVQPTTNIPYATPGALPTLRPAAPATPGTPQGNPVATTAPTPSQPGAGSPTPTR